MLGFFGFLLDWLITRDWRRSAWLLVPLVPALTLFMMSAWGASVNKEQLANRYLSLGESELKDVDNDWAFRQSSAEAASESQPEVVVSRYTEALFRRAQELQSGNPRAAFVIAAVLGQQGARAEALAMMQRLAPDNSEGYAPAHAWIADYMMRQGSVTAEQLPKFKHHVQIAASWEYAPANLLAVATNLAMEAQNDERAIELLAQSAEKQPEFEAELFRLALSEDNKRLAEQTAEKALPRLLALVADGKATAADRIALADMLYYRQEVAAAQGALEDGLEAEDLTEEDRRKLSRALSELFRLRYAASLVIAPAKDSWTADVRMLDLAMQADPTNPMIAEEVAKLARIGGENPPDSLMNQLQDYLASGAATGITHSWLAEAYILREDYANAITHLNSVVTRMPDSAQGHNNLAYALALSAPDRMDEALEHARKAVELDATKADFHDTLGYILLQLGKTAEAIPEFEAAVEKAPGSVLLHERLAEAYEQQGDADLAAAHRRVIEQLQASAQAAKAKQDESKQP